MSQPKVVEASANQLPTSHPLRGYIANSAPWQQPQAIVRLPGVEPIYQLSFIGDGWSFRTESRAMALRSSIAMYGGQCWARIRRYRPVNKDLVLIDVELLSSGEAGRLDREKDQLALPLHATVTVDVEVVPMPAQEEKIVLTGIKQMLTY